MWSNLELKYVLWLPSTLFRSPTHPSSFAFHCRKPCNWFPRASQWNRQSHMANEFFLHVSLSEEQHSSQPLHGQAAQKPAAALKLVTVNKTLQAFCMSKLLSNLSMPFYNQSLGFLHFYHQSLPAPCPPLFQCVSFQISRREICHRQSLWSLVPVSMDTGRCRSQRMGGVQ